MDTLHIVLQVAGVCLGLLYIYLEYHVNIWLWVVGVIMPIVLNKDGNGKYMIIAGERRFRASKIAGKDSIPAIIKDYDDRKIQEISLECERNGVSIEDTENIFIVIVFYSLFKKIM